MKLTAELINYEQRTKVRPGKSGPNLLPTGKETGKVRRI
jgi:hypothetical protein